MPRLRQKKERPTGGFMACGEDAVAVFEEIRKIVMPLRATKALAGLSADEDRNSGIERDI